MLIDIAYVVLKKHEIWMNKKSKMASEFITIIAVSCTQVKCAKSQNEPPLLLSLIRKPLCVSVISTVITNAKSL